MIYIDSRTIPNLDDVALAFDQLGIYLHELEDYVHQVEPVCPSSSLPEVPCHESENHLLHEQDGQFPPPVEIKQEHQQVENEMESEMEIVKEENVEGSFYSFCTAYIHLFRTFL